MLLTTVTIWALSITVSKYILSHGFLPLAYASVRYGAAVVILAAVTLVSERSLAIGGRRDLAWVGIAVLALWLNQICFVYALKLASATTVALILGTVPIFAGLFASLIGLERLTRRSWLAASISFGGVALVALGGGGELGGDLGGDLLAVGTAATWAAYSVAVAPPMRRYSPYRLSAVILFLMWVLLALTGSGQLADQDFGEFGARVWLGFAFAVVGPLVLTTILWFTAIDRVGPSPSE